MSNMAVRIIVGAIGIPLVVALVLYGGFIFQIATVIIAIAGLVEFYDIARKKNTSPNSALGIMAAVALYSMIFFPVMQSNISTILALTVLTAVICELWRKSGSPFSNIAATIGGVLYFPLLFMFVPLLHRLDASGLGGGGGRWLVLALFVSVWMCDSTAYFAGKYFGQRKLFERISPKKTWVGAIAGFFGAIAGFYIAGVYSLPDVAPVHWIVLGSISGLFGQVGDLGESLLKRDAAIKDSSTLLPGHGGILDRFDSMVFVAPLTYFYVTFMIL